MAAVGCTGLTWPDSVSQSFSVNMFRRMMEIIMINVKFYNRSVVKSYLNLSFKFVN